MIKNSKTQKAKKSRFIIYALLSIFLHALLVFILIPSSKTDKKKIKTPKRFSIKLKKKKKIEKKKKKERDLKNKQIVETVKPKIEREPDKAKYLAKYDNKTKKEKKVKKKHNIIKKKIDKKDILIIKKKNISLNKKKSKKDNKKKTEKKLDKKIDKKIDEKALLHQAKNNKTGKNSKKEVKLNISDLQFSQMLNSASNDYLKNVKEGDYTDLNTLAYEYTGYFMKIKNRVSKHWNPAGAYQIHDPYRKIYGIKDRYTVLLITINTKGYLNKIKVQKSSGLSFLDNEAIKAFEKGAPYNIVPTGLLKGKEEFTIQFGFYVDNPSSPRIFYMK